jgi:hypothetical protein
VVRASAAGVCASRRVIAVSLAIGSGSVRHGERVIWVKGKSRILLEKRLQILVNKNCENFHLDLDLSTVGISTLVYVRTRRRTYLRQLSF